MARESSARAFVSILGSPFFRPAALRSIFSIVRNFFLLQYKAVLRPGRYRITLVDHPLDKKIPFNPKIVDTYLDFVHFFIRTQDFLIQNFKKHAGRNFMVLEENFIKALGALYSMAAEVYAKNFSTTERPKYLAKFKFMVIHAFDPHLMCIPSLHVMVVILTYTRLRKILRALGEKSSYASKIESTRKHALAITEAVLYVKQHSINCISAAMYAMTCFDDLFPQEEAEAFARDLFINACDISKNDVKAIQDHIINLYKKFLDEARLNGITLPGSTAKKDTFWGKPLLDFLASIEKNES